MYFALFSLSFVIHLFLNFSAITLFSSLPLASVSHSFFSFSEHFPLPLCRSFSVRLHLSFFPCQLGNLYHMYFDVFFHFHFFSQETHLSIYLYPFNVTFSMLAQFRCISIYFQQKPQNTVIRVLRKESSTIMKSIGR